MAKRPLEFTRIARKERLPKRESVLKEIETRAFDGGLNVVDSELKLSSRFATHMKNVYRSDDGSVVVRTGSICLTDVERDHSYTFLRYGSSLSEVIAFMWTGTIFRLNSRNFHSAPGSQFPTNIRHLPGWLRRGAVFRFSPLPTGLWTINNTIQIHNIHPDHLFIVQSIDSSGTLDISYIPGTGGSTLPQTGLIVNEFYDIGWRAMTGRTPETQDVGWIMYNRPIFAATHPNAADSIKNQPVPSFIKGMIGVNRDSDMNFGTAFQIQNNIRFDTQAILSVETMSIKLLSWTRQVVGPQNPFPAPNALDDRPCIEILMGVTNVGPLISQPSHATHGVDGTYVFNPISIGTVGFARWQDRIIIGTQTNKLLEFIFTNLGTTALNGKLRPVSDPITGTVHIPSGDIVRVFDRRLLVTGRGVPLTSSDTDFRPQSILYISARDAYTVFNTDNTMSGPATTVDFSRLINTADTEIMGLATFREFLVVLFKSLVVLCRIVEERNVAGTVTTFTTRLEIVDSVNHIGCIGPQAVVTTGEDLFIFSTEGLFTLKKSLYSGVIDNQMVSHFISPEYKRIIAGVSTAQLRNSFAYYIKEHNQLVFHLGGPDGGHFVYNVDGTGYAAVAQQPIITSRPCLVFTKVRGTDEVGWSEFTNIAANCATVIDDKYAIYGVREHIFYRPVPEPEHVSRFKPFSTNIPVFQDYVNAPALLNLSSRPAKFIGVNPNNRTEIDSFSMNTSYNSAQSPLSIGAPIFSGRVPFIFSLPNTELGEALKIKALKYVRLFIDGFVDNPITPHTDPQLLPALIVHTDSIFHRDERFCVFDNLVRFAAYIEPGNLSNTLGNMQAPFPPERFYKTLVAGTPVYRFVDSAYLIPLGIRAKTFKISFVGFALNKTQQQRGALRLIGLTFMYSIGGIRK